MGDVQINLVPRYESRHSAETSAEADSAFDPFAEDIEFKYPKAVEFPAKARDVLIAFFDLPAEHWPHLRTTNPIESTFATVRLRYRRTKGNGSYAVCRVRSPLAEPFE